MSQVLERPASYTMSLAAGIRKRDVRVLNSHPYSDVDLYGMLLSRTSAKRKVSKVSAELGTMQRRHQFKGYLFGNQTISKGRCYLFAYPVSGGFEFSSFSVNRHDVDASPMPIRLTYHAIDRIIYRKRCLTLLDAIIEIVQSIANIVPISLSIEEGYHVGESICVATNNGFAIVGTDYNPNPYDDLPSAAIVTWCTSMQELENQGTIVSTFDYLNRQAQHLNMNPLDYIIKLWGCTLHDARMIYASTGLHTAIPELAKPDFFELLLK